MGRPSRREVESRLADVVGEPDESLLDEAPWLCYVPRELWEDRISAWRYYITGGSSHPGLGGDEEDGERDEDGAGVDDVDAE